MTDHEPRHSTRLFWSQPTVDVAERAVWTLLEAGVGVSLVAALDLPPAWAVVIAGVLAAVKGQLATKFGDGSAATLPADKPLEFAPPVVDPLKKEP